jgi:hypothetical protein
MGGIQIENLLALMEGDKPFDRAEARREVLEYLKVHMTTVAADIEKKGEAVIPTTSGTFILTRDDLTAAA